MTIVPIYVSIYVFKAMILFSVNGSHYAGGFLICLFPVELRNMHGFTKQQFHFTNAENHAFSV